MDDPWIWIAIVVVAVVLFGGKRLPDAARGLGRSLRIFKAETQGLLTDDHAGQGAQGSQGQLAPGQQPVPPPSFQQPNAQPAPPVAGQGYAPGQGYGQPGYAPQQGYGQPSGQGVPQGYPPPPPAPVPGPVVEHSDPQ